MSIDDPAPQDPVLFESWLKGRTHQQMAALYLELSKQPGSVDADQLSILFREFLRRVREIREDGETAARQS
jgi:hypothetical protein